MKKKFFTNPKDKKDWIDFTSNMGDISTKETDLLKENIQVSKVKKLDLHGLSLIDANKSVKEFITKHYNGGFKKILIMLSQISNLSPSLFLFLSLSAVVDQLLAWCNADFPWSWKFVIIQSLLF